MENQVNNTIKLIAGNIVLLVSYYISAHITLSLGLPPIGGAPVWIPSGISLAAILIWGYRLLPAVFIGGFIIGAELFGLGTTTAVLVSILFGVQAGGHAWLTVWLLRKLHLWPNLLVKESEIVKFFLVTVLSLLIVTLLFVLFKWALGVLSIDQLISPLFLWWAGGVIGIVLFTPIVLILFAQPKQQWRRRVFSVALPLLLMFILLIIVIISVRQNDQQTRVENFNEHAAIAHRAIQNEVAQNALLLHAMRAYFKNAQNVSYDEFVNYFYDLDDYRNSISGVAWIDYVRHEDRQNYEQQYAGSITELSGGGMERVARIRADYFVIRYSRVPSDYRGNHQQNNMNMFDLCFNPERAQICQQIISSKEAAIMAPIMEKPSQRKQFVYVLPVMDESEAIVGMVAHMYQYQILFDAISRSSVKQWIELTVTDISQNTPPVILFNSRQQNDTFIINHDEPLEIIKTIEIGGRKWQLEYVPSQYFIESYNSWILYWIVTSALFIFSMISLYLLTVTGRMQQVRQEVADKTKEILKTEEKFRRLVEGVKDEYILYAHNLDGEFTYVSPSITNILGYSCDEFLCHFSTFMTDSSINKLVNDYTQRAILGESVPTYEVEVFHKTGAKHILKITENATKDDQGKTIAVEGVAQDVTQSKYKHMQLEQRSLAVKNSPNGVIITDREGVIEYVNPRFTEITGYSSLEAIGRKPNILKTTMVAYKDMWDTLLSGKPWRGELRNSKKNGDLYWSQEHICPLFGENGDITHFVVTQQDVTDKKQIHEEKVYQASHDVLTGLVNRREFEIRLERIVLSSKVDSSEHALCFMDLDQFKMINDICGHVAGDELLRQVGDLLRSNVRQRDTLARLGGDEFALIMEYCSIEQAYDSCLDIIDLLADFRFHWEEHIFTLGVSIGLTVIDRHIKNNHQALSHADTACYAAKDAGRNRVVIHTEDNELLRQRKGDVQWSKVINEALDLDRFLLYVQSIVPLQDKNQRICYEVLLRLKMEDGTIAPPSAFLPAAERYSLAVRIDRWVVQHTLKWMGKHIKLLDHVEYIAINLSGQSLGDNTMLAFIVEELYQYDQLTSKIKFEITETAAIANLRHATVFISTLVELGCSFALDDFGSGLSSFAYLKNLNVDSLKIDGMFVKDILQDPIDLEMVKSINDIGHVMGIQTIAEFVENEKIADKLREIGVDYAQGFAFSKPAPIDVILKHA